MPFLIGIEEDLMEQAEDNINDGTYIIDLDKDKITSKQKTSVVVSNSGRFKNS
jgi:phosphotransferase system IIA component